MANLDTFIPNVYTQNPTIFDQVILLTKERQQQPAAILKEFFENRMALSEVRSNLYELGLAAMTSGEPRFDDHLHRSSLLLFCQEIEVIMEAAFLLKNK